MSKSPCNRARCGRHAPAWFVLLSISTVPPSFSAAPVDAAGSDTGGTTVSVADYGAMGDGITDDTAAIQAALNAVSSGTVTFPATGSCYKSGNLLISNKANFTFDGNNQTICWSGTAAPGMKIGMQYSGQLTDVSIENFNMVGDGILAHGHAGVWGLSGGVLTNIKVAWNSIYNVTLGISINADLAGQVNGFDVYNNYISGIVGTAPGQGYGIHHANGSGLPSNGRILNNTIVSAQRHGIYQANGSGVLIANNVITNHRKDVSTVPGYPLPAIVIARSSDIVVQDNSVVSAKDGSIEVTNAAGHVCSDIVISGMLIRQPVGPFQPVTIGTTDPAGDGVCSRVILSDSSISYDYGGVNPAIQIYSGKSITLVNNTINASSASGNGAVIQVRGIEETPGTAQYTNDISVLCNAVHGVKAGGELHAVWIFSTAAASAIEMRFIHNLFDVPDTAFVTNGPETDPNITVIDTEDAGLAAVGTGDGSRPRSPRSLPAVSRGCR